MAADVKSVAKRGRPPLRLIDVVSDLGGDRLPKPADRVGTWIDPRTCEALCAAGLRTVGDLREMYRKRGPTWFNAIQSVGKARGAILNEWLTTTGLVKPFSTSALTPLSQEQVMAPISSADKVTAKSGSSPVFDVVLAEPREGTRNRRDGTNALGAHDDISAIAKWLASFDIAGRRRTVEAYRRETERYVIWCRWIGVKFSETSIEHAHRYQAFLANIPPEFIGHERVSRNDPRWRPFRGTLSARSQNYALQVVTQCHEALQRNGYLHFNPFASLKRPAIGGRSMDTSRALNHEDLEWAKNEIDALGERCKSALYGLSLGEAHQIAIGRRTVLAFLILLHTGMRLEEVATTTLASLRPARMNGQEVHGLWALGVHGKGGRERDVYLPDSVLQMVRRHHEDVADLLTMTGGQSVSSRLDALKARPPLICALTAPVGNQDTRAIDDAAQMANDNLALGKMGLYKTLKTFFRTRSQDPIKAIRLKLAVLEEQGDTGGSSWMELRRELEVWNRRSMMSTHWLRHTFAQQILRSSGNDQGLKMAQQLLGHQSITTTAEYLRQDETEKVKVLSSLDPWGRR